MEELCVPCKEGNETTKSDGFCEDCEEHMCKTCFQHHLKARHCRNHALLNSTRKEKRKGQVRSMEKCEKHDNQSIRYYCRKHDQVGCGDCMLFEGHTACQPECIKNVASDIREQEEFKSMAKLKTFEEDNKANVTKLQENRQSNAKLSSKAIESAKSFRASVNSHLDKAEDTLKAQVEKNRLENEKKLNELESNCKSMDSDIEDCNQLLTNPQYPEHVLFIHSIVVKPKLRLIGETIEETKRMNKIDHYEFKPNEKLKEMAAASASLGTLENVAETESSTVSTVDNTTGSQNDTDNATGTPTSFQIFIKFITGRTTICSVLPFETIESLKKQIESREGIPVSQLKLHMALTGKELNDRFQISDYYIRSGSTINCRLHSKIESTDKDAN